MRIQPLVIPTGAGANATAEWRNLLFLATSRPVPVTTERGPAAEPEQWR
jgi:hypothetical protein